MHKERIAVYVDGFNFYFGLKANNWKKYYWLDMVSFIEKFLKPHQEIVSLQYFSAPPHNQAKALRQNKFFSANKMISTKFSFKMGKFLKKEITCRNCKYPITSYEEKQTDVNIALAMVNGVIKNLADATILVSADSDLVSPLDYIRSINPSHKVFVYFPPNRKSYDLQNKSTKYIHLERHEQKFQTSLMNDVITLANGHSVVRPDSWK